MNRMLVSMVAVLIGTGVSFLSAEPSTTTAPTTVPARPFEVIRIDLPGPVRGVAVRVDLSDPHVRLKVVAATPDDPDGDGPAVTTLDTVATIAERHGLEFAINASFFSVTRREEREGKPVSYFVGNAGYPVGWLVIDGDVLTKPQKPAFENVLLVRDGLASIESNVATMPADVDFGVSGNVRLLDAGQVTPSTDESRHPRSAAGLSADRRLLWLVAIDGRRDGWSRGVTYRELATILKDLGATTP
jgi:hypothetical protein